MICDDGSKIPYLYLSLKSEKERNQLYDKILHQPGISDILICCVQISMYMYHIEAIKSNKDIRFILRENSFALRFMSKSILGTM